MNDIKFVLTGFCMGVANIIPGISGGTIAFLLGVYEPLIRAVKSFNLSFLRLLCRFRFKEAFSHIPLRFIGAVFAGIIAAVLAFSKIMSGLLSTEPILVYSFFFGLILATVPIMARIIRSWTFVKAAAVVLSAMITYYFVGMVPFTTPEAAWFIFLSGALAICTMILPGISGSFVLVLLGKYQFILDAINNRDLFVLGIFSFGMIVGIVGFVRILSWLFNKYHDAAVIVLTGIVIGSLRKIWPWKEITRMMTTSRGKIIPIAEVNILPARFDGDVLLAIVVMIVGFTAALTLNSSSGEKTLKS